MNTELDQKYNIWNEKKKILASCTEQFLFKEREIWWCSIGINIGTETLGKGDKFQRPVLIIKKLSGEACIVAPLTTRERIGSWFIDIPLNNTKNWVMLHQIRMIHANRFQRRLDTLDVHDFNRVKGKLEALLELSSNNHSDESEIGGYTPRIDIYYQDWIMDASPKNP